jgi:ABC-2 type transport system permease protein
MTVSSSNATARPSLDAIVAGGWHAGFENLLRNECRLWWGTRRWLWQSLIWLIVINGIMALATWGAPKGPNPTGVTSDPRAEAARALVLAMGVFAPIGVLIMAQSAIVGEKQSGTAAWILSKPVARNAVILAKLVAYIAGIFATIVILQGAIAYTQLVFALDNPPSTGEFVASLGLLSLNLLFYLCLTLMLGAIVDSRGPVIGIAIAILLFQELFADNAGLLVLGMPVALSKKLAQPLLTGQPTLSAIVPVVATTLWSLLCIGVAIWRFNREDF